MAVEITPRAIEVLRRALEAARLAPSDAGIQVTLARSLRGPELRTGFAEQAEPGEETIEAGGIRLFVGAEISGILDVADEHDRIVLR
ncbi:MAG: hypothetical protein WAT66_01925 [Actinomycetota bacterium]